LPRARRNGRRIAVAAAVLITVLVGSGACTATSLVQSPPGGPGQAPAGPALGVYPPNATRVTARVLKQAVYTAAAPPSGPAIPPGTTLHALMLQIQDARPARADVAMGPAVGVIEAFSPAPLAPGLVGRRLEATVTLAGDTASSRWFISDIRILSD
jgi:hypothetical protein